MVIFNREYVRFHKKQCSDDFCGRQLSKVWTPEIYLTMGLEQLYRSPVNQCQQMQKLESLTGLE